MSAVRWVVSKGDYSDYRVVCVCDSEKRAKHVAALMNADADSYDKAHVEALPFVNYNPEKINVYRMSVTVWDDGRTTDERENIREEWPFDALFPESLQPVSWRWVRAPIHEGKGGRLDVSGTDLGRVRRTLSDKRAQLLQDDVMRGRREATGRTAAAAS